MSTDWSIVLKQALAAAKGVIGDNWSTVQTGAIHAVQQLIQTGQYIKANASKMSDDERQSLVENQKFAMQTVLLGYEDIGRAVAAAATAAAWAVIEKALVAALAF